MKKIILYLFTIIILINTIFAYSQSPYCYAGSDYYTFSYYQENKPILYTLYDDTEIYFDINHDGVYEYIKRFDKNKRFIPNFGWKIQDGTYIHSSKPIIYIQKLDDERYDKIEDYSAYTCIPPISSLKDELVLFSFATGNDVYYKIVAIENNMQITTDFSTSIQNIKTKKINLDSRKTSINFWMINSTGPVFAVSTYGTSSVLDYDFTKTIDGSTYIIAVEDNTTISIDNNGDDIFDHEEMINKGKNGFSLNLGARIKSDKKIGVFEISNTLRRHYSQAILTKSLNNENILVNVERDYLYINGVKNDDNGTLLTYFNITDLNNDLIETNTIESNKQKRITTDLISKVFSDNPVFLKYDYKRTVYPPMTYFLRGYPTIEPYISLYTNKKFFKINSSETFNARIFNPTNKDIKNVSITLNLQNLFIKDNKLFFTYYIKDLDTDFLLKKESKTIFGIDYGLFSEFDINFDNLSKNNYIDIRFSIDTPFEIGRYSISPIRLRFD